MGADLAFLVMDLVHAGRDDLAAALVAAYRAAGGDPGDDALVSFFACYRAWVRAKVAMLRAGELAPGAPRAAELDRTSAYAATGRRLRLECARARGARALRWGGDREDAPSAPTGGHLRPAPPVL